MCAASHCRTAALDAPVKRARCLSCGRIVRRYLCSSQQGGLYQQAATRRCKLSAVPYVCTRNGQNREEQCVGRLRVARVDIPTVCGLRGWLH